jgi:anthranilate phosphoribosyltransferase
VYIATSNFYSKTFSDITNTKHSITLFFGVTLLNEPNVLCFRGEGGEIEFNPLRDVTLHIARGSVQTSQDVANTLDTYVTKPKELDSAQLIKVWQGEVQDKYAEHATLGTLANMLVLLDASDWQTAHAKATTMWDQRNKTWPVAKSLQ